MADLTTKPVLSVCATVGSKLADLPQQDGQLIFIQDKHKIAFDFGGKRRIYSQIEELATEGARTSMLAPVTGTYYFVLETAVLWTYQSGWIQITTPPANKSAFPLNTNWYFNNLALAKAAAATATELGGNNATYYWGMKLYVDTGDSAKWYVIQKNGTLLEEGAASLSVDNHTLVYDENGILKVNTTNDAEADNTLPITSAGVYMQLGNISALLDTI